MTDVFISYKKEERARCERIAAKLKALGLDVWFDVRLETGKEFPVEIQKAVTAAKAVLVLWSGKSVQSRWVCNEARRGKNADKLVAATLEPIPADDFPVEFDGTYYEALHDPNFQDDDPAWLRILERIAQLTNRPSIVSYSRALAQAAIPLEQWAKQNANDPLARQMATKAALLGGAEAAQPATPQKRQSPAPAVAAAALVSLVIGAGAGWFVTQAFAVDPPPPPPPQVAELTLEQRAASLVGRYSLDGNPACAEALHVWYGPGELRMTGPAGDGVETLVSAEGDWVRTSGSGESFAYRRDGEGLHVRIGDGEPSAFVNCAPSASP